MPIRNLILSPMTTTSPGWSGGDPDDFTALTLVRAVPGACARVFTATLAPFDLPPHHFSVLLHLVERPGISQADLARVVLATPQSVGELVRTMEDKGLVERTPPAGPRAAVRGLRLAGRSGDPGRGHPGRARRLHRREALGLDEETHDRLNADLHAVMAALGP